MSRLQAEQQRLFGQRDTHAPGQVRAAVLELVQPSGWSELAALWQGVQAGLDLPAPAIAVNGRDGYQLWFSLAQPVATAQAQAFLEALRHRYLPGVPPERVRAHVGDEGSGSIRPLPHLPPVQVGPERWSAFLAPDLVPVFADEPWLDHPPGAEAQADLLSRMQATGPEAFGRALAALSQADKDEAAQPVVTRAGGAPDPRGFLLSVMQDETVDLRLRIEAAKALLQADRR